MGKKQFKTESKRILDMMINSVYTNRDIFLRELISNASDAIDKLSYKALTDDSITMSREDYKITITPDKEKRTLTLSDNGIGMTDKELEENLGVIAKSGSLKFKSELEKTEDTPDIIGQFGVGFYSAFMAASKVTVLSKAWGSDKAYMWQSSGADGYTVTEAEKETCGTDITLYLKEDTEEGEYSKYLEDYTLKGLIRLYSDYIRWPIRLSGETVNSMIPLWQRQKSEVSDEDCARFYKETFHDSEDPTGIIRVNAEGTVSYRAMLFIPSNVPYDYYTASYTPGLKLYSGGVMIMEACADLLPDCFRFVRGIVDSPDLSLNISRELLQQDRQLRVIASSLEKRIKNELTRVMANDREKYEKFYSGFGLQLKYGVVNELGAKKELLKDLLLFYSEKKGGLVSLDEYVKDMPEEQKYIYFACGENISIVSGMPQTERIRDVGYDILYMTDSVDEFVTGILESYDEKQFRSVNDDDLGIDFESAKAEAEKIESESTDLLSFAKETLSDKVAAVKISHKLKSHAVCLSTQGMITLEMEKYFASLPGETGEKIKAERVLEINPASSQFETLKNAYETDKEKAADMVKLMYAQAQLMAGYLPDDPAEISLLIGRLIK